MNLSQNYDKIIQRMEKFMSEALKEANKAKTLGEVPIERYRKKMEHSRKRI